MPTETTAREISPLARRTVENIWLLFTNYRASPVMTTERLKDMLAAEVQKAMDENPEQPPKQLPMTAVLDCVQELTAVLCHQPSVPLDHKTDLLNRLGALQRACGAPVWAAKAPA